MQIKEVFVGFVYYIKARKMASRYTFIVINLHPPNML